MRLPKNEKKKTAPAKSPRSTKHQSPFLPLIMNPNTLCMHRDRIICYFSHHHPFPSFFQTNKKPYPYYTSISMPSIKYWYTHHQNALQSRIKKIVFCFVVLFMSNRMGKPAREISTERDKRASAVYRRAKRNKNGEEKNCIAVRSSDSQTIIFWANAMRFYFILLMRKPLHNWLALAAAMVDPVFFSSPSNSRQILLI